MSKSAAAGQAAAGAQPTPRGLPINPPAARLGHENAILMGRGRSYHVPDFEGCLSIKTVTAGSASWETKEGRFVLAETCYLVLNDRQRYTITVGSARPVETFCLFFARGFVEDVLRGATTADSELLSSPGAAGAYGLHERIEPADDVLAAVRSLRLRLVAGGLTPGELEDAFFAVAERLVAARTRAGEIAARLPGRRAATRQELLRRLLRGRDLLLSSLGETVRLADAARAAYLSPYHFHRAFTRTFGATPHAFLVEQRLQRARHLLSSTARSATEIAFECGFETLGSLSTLFARRFGASPRRFRTPACAPALSR